MHLFAITDAEVPTLCNSCHGDGNSNVDAKSLQASVVAGLQTIVNNMGTAIVARLNDDTGKTAPAGYGAWTDTGTINIAAGGLTDTTPGCSITTDPSCGLASSGVVSINTTANPVVSAVATPQGRIARYYFGISFPARDLRLGLIEAAAGKIGSPMDKILLMCFHYDPRTGKYNVAVMNVIRLLGCLTLTSLGTFMIVMFRRDRRKSRLVDL